MKPLAALVIGALWGLIIFVNLGAWLRVRANDKASDAISLVAAAAAAVWVTWALS